MGRRGSHAAEKTLERKLQKAGVLIAFVAIIASTLVAPILEPTLKAAGEVIKAQICEHVMPVLCQPANEETTPGEDIIQPTSDGHEMEKEPPSCDNGQQAPPCWHTVQKGDTLSGISRKYFGTAEHWELICASNYSLLERHFRSDLAPELQTEFASPCRYIAPGWQILIPAVNPR